MQYFVVCLRYGGRCQSGRLPSKAQQEKGNGPCLDSGPIHRHASANERGHRPERAKAPQSIPDLGNKVIIL